MKYLSSQPIVFGSENNKDYADTYMRVFGAAEDKKDWEQGKGAMEHEADE